MFQIDYKKGFFLLTFRYNQSDLQRVRNLPVRKWHKPSKTWIVPELALKTIENFPAVWTLQAKEAKNRIEKHLLELIDLKFEKALPKGILRPYQNTGTAFLQKAKRALLCDDMGLGKTIQSIQALLDLNCKSVLILCPATLKYNWLAEFKKHFNIDAVVISGNALQRKKLWITPARFIIANYDILIYDWGVMPKTFDAIVTDEAVAIKNPKAERTKLARKLKSEYRFALSGMPIELDLMEFHSIMEWVQPQLLPNYKTFKYRYCKLDWNGKVIGVNERMLLELHLLTAPFILRRTKEEVLPELPEKINFDIPLEFDELSRDAYKKLCRDFEQQLRNDNKDGWQSRAMYNLLLLREFVEFPQIININLPSTKLQWLESTYPEMKKVVVFTFFKRAANILIKHFNTPYHITGDDPPESRIKMVDGFNKEKTGIMVCTDAARFGINLTGVENIVHFGNVFNPATMEQREDRLHRFGQENVVNVFSPYIMNTVDEGIRKIFLDRRMVAEDFIEGSEKMSLVRLSKNDFLKLIGQ